MENKKLTAVEWLRKEMERARLDALSSYEYNLFNQALELEKQQHNRTYLAGAFEMELKTGKSFEQYYQNTYGNK